MSRLTLFLCILLSFIIPESSEQINPTSSTGQSETYNTASSNQFEYKTIICSKRDCTVICDASSGCLDLIIDAHQSSTLQLTCSTTNSCKDVIINMSAQISTEIDCTGSASCRNTQFNVANSISTDINCNYISGTSTTGACYYSTINATDSTNLTVTCDADYSCRYMDVYCPLYINGKCDIECGSSSDTYSCSYMDIFTPDTSNINIDCGTTRTQYGCSGTNIYCGLLKSASSSSLQYATTDTSWRCTTDECCPFYQGMLDCNGQSGSICTIDCITNDCSNYVIDGSAVSSVFTVNCNATNGGCNGANIKCPDTYSSAKCVVDCQNDNSCKSVIIRGSDAYSLDLDCKGSESCLTAKIYCPSDRTGACNIDCSNADYRVCYNMDIFTDNSFLYDYLDINCSLSNSNSVCTSTTINCESDTVITTKTDVSLIYDTTEKEWECQYKSSSYCCPWINTEPIECSSSSCNIDCTIYDCAGVIVNGTASNSLTLYCGNAECDGTTVICPYGTTSSSCSIDCSSKDGCKDMIIYANDTNTLIIDCDYTYTCSGMIVYAQNVQYLTFDSNGYDSYYVNIYAHNAYNIDLFCKGDYSCYYMNVYADNANSIELVAGYKYGFSYGTLNATNANSVTISCASESGEYGCYEVLWYLPDYGYNTYINCYGDGCEYFGDIYVDTSISSLSLSMNGCDECSSKSLCISSWKIYCGSYSSATFYGNDNCAINCDCNDFEDNISFEDDDSDSQCITSNDYNTTTNANVAAILGSLFGAIFCICFFIVFIIACSTATRRQQYGRYWGRQNYIAPAPGIQAAQMQPATVAKPVQTVPVMMVPMQQQQPIIMMAPQQQQQQQRPVIMYAPVAQQQMQPVQQQQMQPMPQQQMQPVQQPYSTSGGVPQYNASVPSAPYAPSVASAPPSYDQVQQNPSAPGQTEGGVTNY